MLRSKIRIFKRCSYLKSGIYGFRKDPKNRIFCSTIVWQQTIEEQKQNSIFRDFSEAIYTGLQIRTSLPKMSKNRPVMGRLGHSGFDHQSLHQIKGLN